MKVLILSCGTGGGHNACAQGLYEAFTKEGHAACIKTDYLSLAGRWKEHLVCSLYTECVKKSPVLFKTVYAAGRMVSTFGFRRRLKSPVYYANARMERYLENILKKKKYDLVVATHLYPAETLTALKNKGVKLPTTVAVATDYTCIPFWEETDCDYYVVPHKECMEEFCRRGIPRRKLLPIGIPAPLQFHAPNGKKKRGPRILIMGGSMGAGDLSGFVEEAERRMKKSGIGNHSLYVVCGTNRKLQRQLAKRWKKRTNVHVLGYVRHPERLMEGCGLLFTKPGGLTATESAICRIPTVFMQPISQCETANAEFFARHHMALFPKTEEACIMEGIALLKDKKARRSMREAQRCLMKENPAKEAVRAISKIINSEPCSL